MEISLVHFTLYMIEVAFDFWEALWFHSFKFSIAYACLYGPVIKFERKRAEELLV